ncbi:putative RNA recognition motif domain, nucleotide-binding alpha-beta plait domain superfamily [Helianthus annuus]|uniref:RNA recognition motif domain, nucleotide-binding alpha-beta plait domain superfamily n=1 Tax=Helianthus annuus TaxID=4232 RepID=A0A9K3GVJ9_HELAN|nr:putative RNA recognition motif domain, nucleotide-binding alpha-beta plait domain superfamily [Helianthus annuus]KAJ0430194.1 putative RNA recognition motif domain, nucleotide-binding alpha-beta plait domain superfamily [Helianthus annuus]KAJ0448619.1 putative RNA recognition motif domain, nucleotide-binding alpha-beta plait domain superfamily [Helianthus annuus]KAJ0633499.1 putative RNA recognition motif domain, nucleotide-binding alpha-beta plait domain superfamily [Helianthus annuus]KAJ06
MDSGGPWLDPHHLKKKNKGYLPQSNGRDNTMKFFVSNLPDKCCSKDIGEFFGVFGVVTGVYIARKRDKNGLKLGFVCFSGVSDGSEMEGRMKGLKIGSFKLSVNVARFVAENNSYQRPPMVSKVQNVSRDQPSGPSGVDKGNLRFGSRDVRSYSDVVGNPFGAGGSFSGPSSGLKNNDDKKIVVPDRTAAFSELYDVAVVGRAVDLETLVDLDKLLRIAKTSFSNIQYLGVYLSSFHSVTKNRLVSFWNLVRYGVPGSLS